MKKFIYISGIILINIIAFGAIFKIEHWPGAGLMLMFSMVLFAFCFLPMALINSYKGNGNKNKPLYIAGYICALFSIIAILFKFQHWGGASLLMIIGIPLPFLYFLPVYIYYHNKEKEKSSMNFLGVMLLMVFIALFTSMLSINVSRNILDAMRRSSIDLSQTTDMFTLKNASTYESINKTDNAEINDKVTELKKRSDAVSGKIENVKTELVQRITGYDSSTIRGNKIIMTTFEPTTEINGTTFIMRGNEGIVGRATEIKNALADYRKYMNSILAGNKESLSMVNAMLNTADSTYTVNGETQTNSWDDSFFPRNTYIINVLGNLDCIETYVKMAEAEGLSYLCSKK
jgi:hypothetical protein